MSQLASPYATICIPSWYGASGEKCKTCERELPMGEVYQVCFGCLASICAGCVNTTQISGLKLCGACAVKFSEDVCPNCRHSFKAHFKDPKKMSYSGAIGCQHSIALFTSAEPCNCQAALNIAKELNAVPG